MALNVKKLKEFSKRAASMPPPKATLRRGEVALEADEGPDGEEDGDVVGDESDQELAARAGARVSAGEMEDALSELLESDPPDDSAAPDWALDEKLWARAQVAVKVSGGAQAFGKNTWAVVAQTYSDMGGEVDL